MNKIHTEYYLFFPKYFKTPEAFRYLASYNYPLPLSFELPDGILFQIAILGVCLILVSFHLKLLDLTLEVII